MKRSIHITLLSIFFSTFFFPLVLSADPVPGEPSLVTVNGKQLEVRHRRWDGTLKSKVNYVIKGVAWNPAQSWPVMTFPPGAPFENDSRFRIWQMAKHDFPRIREAGFNTIRLYCDIGLSDDSRLYFDEDTDGVYFDIQYWAGPQIYQYKKFYDEDGDGFQDWQQGMPMTGGLRFSEAGKEAAYFGKLILDEAYRNGLKVIMLADGLNANAEIAKKVVTTYKDHPAVLMWMIGNEFNYNFDPMGRPHDFMFRFDTFPEACEATILSKAYGANQIAYEIKQLDSSHPVAVGLGGPAYPGRDDDDSDGLKEGDYWEVYKEGLERLTNVDIVGINLYSGKSFTSIYKEFSSSDILNCSKPIFLSEYGVDTWHYMSDENREYEDLFGQKEGICWQWDDIHAHLSAQNTDCNLIGGCVFEWVDEWWKYSGKSPLVQETLPGFPVKTEGYTNQYLYPDGCMHEEWWGINSQNNENDTNVTPLGIYFEGGLLNEAGKWDIFTWGIDDGYGEIHEQAEYISFFESSRRTVSPQGWQQHSYSGGGAVPEGVRCMYMKVFGLSYGAGWGIANFHGIDFSAYASGKIKFDIKIRQSDDSPIGVVAEDVYFKFEDKMGGEVFVWLNDSSRITGFDASSTQWQSLSLDVSCLHDGHSFVSDFGEAGNADVNLERLFMPFATGSKKIRSGEPSTEMWIDNVRYVSVKDNSNSHEYEYGDVTYNRIAKPVLEEYRDNFNPLSSGKTACEIEAVSSTSASMDYFISTIAKNESTVIYDAYSVVPEDNGSVRGYGSVIAAAIDGMTGDILEWVDKDSAAALDEWIDAYDDPADDMVLAFAVNHSCAFLNESLKLDSIGSIYFSNVDAYEPWVFITHIRDGKSIARKESDPDSPEELFTAFQRLCIAIDRDRDGIIDVEDADKDGDYLNDFLEIRFGTNIWDKDTDDDGYSDFDEVVTHLTNPRNPDSCDLSADTQARLMIPGSLSPLDSSSVYLEFSSYEKERYLYIENDGGETLLYQISPIAYVDGNDWLSICYRDHANQETWAPVETGSYAYDDQDDYILKVAIDAQSLPSSPEGRADAFFTITAKDDDGTVSGTRQIHVSACVKPKLKTVPMKEPALLHVFRPSDSAGTSTAEIDIENDGYGMLSWTASTPAGWLQITPSSGTTQAEVDRIVLTVDWALAGDDAKSFVKIDSGDSGIQFISIYAQNRRKYEGSVDVDTIESSFVGEDRYQFSYTGQTFNGTSNAVSAGDVNGDGFDDILVGAPGVHGDVVYTAGQAFLLFGRENRWEQQKYVDNSAVAFTAGGFDRNEDGILTWDNPFEQSDNAGCNIFLADVNNDGYDDVIIGDYLARQSHYSRGNGRCSIFLSHSSKIWKSHIPMDEADVRIYTGNTTGFQNWCDDMAVGDFNHDGCADILAISTYFKSPSYIIFGRASWPQGIQEVTLMSGVTEIIDNGAGRYRYTAAGDFNGDGTDDLAIYNYNSLDVHPYKVCIVYGKDLWNSSMDVTDEADVIIHLDETITVDDIASGGDVNGDGCDDLLIGRYLIFGSSSLPPVMTLTADAGTEFPYDIIYNHPLFIIPDFNGDGFDEIAQYVSPDLKIYYGRAAGTWPPLFLSGEEDIKLKEGVEQHCASAGDVDGDGKTDILGMNPGWDSSIGRMIIARGADFILTHKNLLFYKVDSSSSQDFFIRNVALDGQNIDWTASKEAGWIVLSKTSGTELSSNDSDAVTVTVDPSGLTDGVYTDDVIVTSGGHREKLKVTMIVNNVTKPLLSPDHEHIVIGAPDITGTFKIFNDRDGEIRWSLTENEDWITDVSPSSGVTVTGEDVITVTVERSPDTCDETGKISIMWSDTQGHAFYKDVFVTMKKSLGAIEPVFWTDIVGVAVSGNSIGNNAAVEGWGNSGAASLQEIFGDGYMDFRADETHMDRMCGLSKKNKDAHYRKIDHAIYLRSDGTVQVYEKGKLKGDFGIYAVGDRFQIVRKNKIVQYQKNGTVFYTSHFKSHHDLIVDASLYTPGSTVKDAYIQK